jgi:Kef-type K+ transport system membrane component KefB
MRDSGNLLISLALILLATKLAGLVSLRCGVPTVFGKLLAGLVFGPALLHILSPSDGLRAMADVGVILLLFVAGLETDTVELRQVGRAALLSAVGGVVLPFVAGSALARAYGYEALPALFIGVVLTATSVTISAHTLRELGHLQGQVGTTILGAAIIDDVLGVVALALVTALAGGGSAVVVLRLVVFLPLTVIVGRWLVPRVVHRLAAYADEELRFAVILSVVLAGAWAAQELGGLAAITGAYLAGVLVGRTAVRERLAELTNFMGYAFFAPVFFATVGMAVRTEDLRTAPGFALALIVLAVLTKAVGCAAGALCSGFRAGDSLTVGVGMISRGEVALAIAALGLREGVIDQRAFSTAVVMTLVTTLVTPVLLKAMLARRQAPRPSPLVSGTAPLREPRERLEPERPVGA